MLDLTRPATGEPALALANDQLRAILAASPLAMISTDFDRNVVFWNAAAERLFGWTAAEIVGKRLPFVPADREDESQGFARRLRAGEQIEDIETVRLHRDGTPIDVSISLAPVLGDDGIPCGTIGIMEDIGQRRRDATALSANEQRWRGLMQSVPALIATTDAQGAVDFHNERWSAFTGLSPAELREQWSTLVHADDLPPLTANWQSALASGQMMTNEYRIRRHDGVWRWHRSTTTPVAGADGAIQIWIDAALDIDDQRNAADELRASEQRWRTIADTMPALVAIGGVDGNLGFFNQRFAEYTGVAQEDLAGDGWLVVVHPDDVQPGMDRWEQTRTNGDPVQFEQRLRRADGAYRTHLCSSQPVRGSNGEIAFWIGVNVDIEDRKREERKRDASDARFRLASIAARLGTWEWDGADTQEWSESLEEIYGFAPGAFPGTTAAFMERVHPDDREYVQAAITAVAQDGSELDLEHRIVCPDGDVRWLNCRGREFLRGAAQPVQIMGIAIDITERKLAELKLEEASQELKRANAAKDEFLGLVSHELRTPITTIFGNAEILEKRGEYVDEESRRVALGDIRNEAGRLHRIVDNLLVLARLEQGQLLDREPILIARIVDRVVGDQRRQHPGSVIDVSRDGTITPVLAAPGYVEQVLRNLLSNAQKYGSGGKIEVVVAREGDRMVTRVLDRGHGISHEDAERIFMPFFRAESTALQAQGVGIGLAVCKRLIEAQSGEMSYCPREGGGSEFTFALPLANEPIDD